MLGYRTSSNKPGSRQPLGGRLGLFALSRRKDHTLGSIIWFGLLRLTMTVVVAWYAGEHFVTNRGEWWLITVGAIYGIVIYPAQIQFEHFRNANKKLMEDTLCSSCRYFNANGLHCTRLDEHVTEIYLPCDGLGWEPSAFEDAYSNEE